MTAILPAMTYRGAWSSGVSYRKQDVVTNGGSQYVATAGGLNHAPPNASFWAVLGGGTGSQGAQGAQGATGAGSQGSQGPQGSQGAQGPGGSTLTGSVTNGVVYWDGSNWVHSRLGVTNFPSAASIPTTGTHAVGDIVFNTTPTAGGWMGWTCVSAGTPGTWKTWGAIAA